jgi:hypothetical protein
MAAEATTGTTAARSRKAGRKRASGEPGGVRLILFFAFLLSYFAIFCLMFCTVVTTFGGMILLLLALMLLVSAYVSGA